MEIGECGGKAKSGVCDAENTTVSEETGNKPAQTEGMTGAVKRLDDNVFAIFGGRSRTPSLGSEGPPELTVCKGALGNRDVETQLKMEKMALDVTDALCGIIVPVRWYPRLR